MHFEETINCFHNISIFDHHLVQWNSRIKLNLVMGFISQASRINFKSGLIGGAVFATAEIVSILAEPFFKKLGYHAFYALKQLPKSLIIVTVLTINPLPSYAFLISLVTVRFFLSIGCKKLGVIDRYRIDIDDCLMKGMQVVFLTQNVMLGIQSIGLLAVVEVIKELGFPWFKQKMEESNDLGHAKIEEIKKNWEVWIEKVKEILDEIKKMESDPLVLEELGQMASTQKLNQQLKEIQSQLKQIEQNSVSIKNFAVKTSYSDEAALSLLSPFIMNLKAHLLLNQMGKTSPFLNLI